MIILFYKRNKKLDFILNDILSLQVLISGDMLDLQAGKAAFERIDDLINIAKGQSGNKPKITPRKVETEVKDNHFNCLSSTTAVPEAG